MFYVSDILADHCRIYKIRHKSVEADKIKMLQARIPEKEKQVKQLKPDKKELHKIEQQVKVNFEAIFCKKFTKERF